ncbi:MAG: MoaD/ThiS family protein [Nitrospinota bacterium]|nr:MoaD/ThiS family protein [Nitrospinota bacterium]
MAIIRLFASLRDKFGANDLQIRITDRKKLRNVLEEAATIHGIDPGFLSAGSFLCAINQQMAGQEDMVGDEDEIAIFPPMSGGM